MKASVTLIGLLFSIQVFAKMPIDQCGVGFEYDPQVRDCVSGQQEYHSLENLLDKVKKNIDTKNVQSFDDYYAALSRYLNQNQVSVVDITEKMNDQMSAQANSKAQAPATPISNVVDFGDANHRVEIKMSPQTKDLGYFVCKDRVAAEYEVAHSNDESFLNKNPQYLYFLMHNMDVLKQVIKDANMSSAKPQQVAYADQVFDKYLIENLPKALDKRISAMGKDTHMAVAIRSKLKEFSELYVKEFQAFRRMGDRCVVLSAKRQDMFGTVLSGASKAKSGEIHSGSLGYMKGGYYVELYSGEFSNTLDIKRYPDKILPTGAK